MGLSQTGSASSPGLQLSGALLALATFNLNRLVKFYTALLGQSPRILQPHRYAEYDILGLRLGLFQPTDSQRPEFSMLLTGNPSPDTVPQSLCLEVLDLTAAIAHLTKLGYAPPGAVKDASHGREIDAYDPDGNRLILYQPYRKTSSEPS